MSTHVSEQTKPDSQSVNRPVYRRPAYNISEDAQGYQVELFVPGVNKAGIDISLKDDTLSIIAQRAVNQTPDGWKRLRREITDADYQLQLEINVPVNRDGISATVEDGVLNLTLPKAEQAKPRQISVN